MSKTTEKTLKIGSFLARFASRYPETDLEVGPVLLRLSSRHDSRGFGLYCGGPRTLAFHWWKRWNVTSRRNMRLPGFCLTFAPLMWLGNRWCCWVNRDRGSRGFPPWSRAERFALVLLGWTFYAVFRARGGVASEPRGRLFPSVRIGLTTNGNRIPYGFA